MYMHTRLSLVRVWCLKNLQLSRAASEEALRALADAAPQGAVDVSTAAAANAAAQGQEAVSRLYRELAARGLLQGFGAVGAGDEPLPNRRVIVAADLPALVGLEQVGWCVRWS